MAFSVWIDQDLCTGDGLCTEICPSVFMMGDDGLARVHINGAMRSGTDTVPVPEDKVEAVVEAAEECPGECIFIEAS